VSDVRCAPLQVKFACMSFVSLTDATLPNMTKRSSIIMLLAVVLAVPHLWAQAPNAASTVPDNSFLLALDAEAGYAICPAPDGGVFAVGARDAEMVLFRISPQGSILSADYLGVGDGSPVYPLSAILDSENKLAIMGRHQQAANARSFILRYDPVLRKTLWSRISEQDFFSTGSLADMPTSDAYAVCLSNFTLEVVRLNRQNGLIMPASAFGYRLDSLTEPKRIRLHQSDVYAVGNHLERARPDQYKGQLPFVLRASMNNGAVAWVKSSPIAPTNNQLLSLAAYDVLVEDGAVYSVLSGMSDGAQVHTFLQKHTLSGDLVWLKEWNMPGIDGRYVSNLFSVPDGFVVYGHGETAFVLKTNKEGEVQWAIRTQFQVEPQHGLYEAIVHDGALYITGTLNSTLPERMYVLKVDLGGKAVACNQLAPMSAAILSVASTPPRTPLLLVPNQPLLILPWPASPPVPFIPKAVLLCSPTEDCTNQPDITFSIDGTACNGGTPALSYTVCNIGATEVSGSVPVWFYPADPTQTSTVAMGSAVLSLGIPLAPGECRSGQLTGLSWLNPSSLQAVYSVVNHDNSLPTPFTLSNLPTTGLEECDYTNNLSSAQLSWPSAPSLNLGPDLILCEKASATLDAGPNFVQYLWQDGSTARTFTATEPGLYYWVEAADACGRIQRDSVFFTFSLLPDTRFGDTVICPGQSVVYTLPGFNTYQWAPAAGLSCTNCSVVTAKPAAPTTYTLLATDTLGCVLRDTFTISFYSSKPALQCPPNITVTATPAANAAVVTYTAPTASTNCPCGAAVGVLTQGLPSGANFPVGVTTVCYSAEDGCLSTTNCCFTVSVAAPPPADQPCDVKETPCLRFEILGISQNAKKEKTYRMRVVNKCAAELVHVAYELPQGIVAVAPSNGVTYTAPSGRQYSVRNPNLSPQRSIRFSSIGPGIALGGADIFQYTLPPQANPLFIYVSARLAPQTYVETHLDVFGCTVQQTQTLVDSETGERTRQEVDAAAVAVFPNPTTDRVYVDARVWPAGRMRVQVVDAFGRVLWDDANALSGALYTLPVAAHWPAGVYHLTAWAPDGQRFSARVVK